MTIRHYLGVAEPGADTWSLSFPAFPGAVTTGDTLAALLTNAQDALASVVEAMQEDGAALPNCVYVVRCASGFDTADYHDPHLVLVPVEVCGRALRINVTMDEGLVARLDRFADRAQSSRSALLARGARMVLASEGGV